MTNTSRILVAVALASTALVVACGAPPDGREATESSSEAMECTTCGVPTPTPTPAPPKPKPTPDPAPAACVAETVSLALVSGTGTPSQTTPTPGMCTQGADTAYPTWSSILQEVSSVGDRYLDCVATTLSQNCTEPQRTNVDLYVTDPQQDGTEAFWHWMDVSVCFGIDPTAVANTCAETVGPGFLQGDGLPLQVFASAPGYPAITDYDGEVGYVAFDPVGGCANCVNKSVL